MNVQKMNDVIHTMCDWEATDMYLHMTDEDSKVRTLYDYINDPDNTSTPWWLVRMAMFDVNDLTRETPDPEYTIAVAEHVCNMVLAYAYGMSLDPDTDAKYQREQYGGTPEELYAIVEYIHRYI